MKRTPTSWIAALLIPSLVACCVWLGAGQQGLVQVAHAQPTADNQELTKVKPAPPVPTGAIVLESIGAVAAVGGIVMLVVGFGALTEKDQAIANNKTDVDTDALQQTGDALIPVGWLVLGAGAVAVIAGTIWTLAANQDDKKNAPTTSTPPATASTPPGSIHILSAQ